MVTNKNVMKNICGYIMLIYTSVYTCHFKSPAVYILNAEIIDNTFRTRVFTVSQMTTRSQKRASESTSGITRDVRSRILCIIIIFFFFVFILLFTIIVAHNPLIIFPIQKCIYVYVYIHVLVRACV